MVWTAERSVSLSEQLSAHATERRCDACGRKFALDEYGVCRWIASGKCDPQ